jgi:putative tryptophan/tyrosine transport system substrate-binding protein
MKSIKEVCFFLLATFLLTTASIVKAQQPKKIPRIGFLTTTSASSQGLRLEAFRQGLKDLGYTEGQTITIEYRFAEGKSDRISNLAAELVRLKVDVIVTGGPSSTGAAKEASSTIPIVMAFDTDPIGNGFVASLARPGRNITGLSTVAPDISGKQLELLKEIVPKLSLVAVFAGNTTGNKQALGEIELAAKAFGVKLQYVDLRLPKDIETGFQAASKLRADAGLVFTNRFTIVRQTQVAELAVKSRLPVIFPQSEYVEAGGLMAYGVSMTDLYCRAATYVDKILKGTKPADIPVEQPMKFEFVINLKAAKQIGLTIPPNVLVRADRVIKEASAQAGGR